MNRCLLHPGLQGQRGEKQQQHRCLPSVYSKTSALSPSEAAVSSLMNGPWRMSDMHRLPMWSLK